MIPGVGDHQSRDIGGGLLADMRGRRGGAVIALDVDFPPDGEYCERTAGRAAADVNSLHHHRGPMRRNASRNARFGYAPGSTATMSRIASSTSTSRSRAPYSAPMV